jgi:altronate hydrolase
MAPPSVIRLHPDDSVVIARATLLPGTPVAEGVTANERIPAGHKVAVRPISSGDPVRRYGQIIGFASQPISPGQHVHVQNCGMGDFAKDYAYGLDARPTDYANTPLTFDGISSTGRPGGDTQLHRHSDQCELFRPRRRADRGRVPSEPVHRR